MIGRLGPMPGGERNHTSVNRPHSDRRKREKDTVRSKRGGGNEIVPLDEAVVYTEERSPEILLLDRALTDLAKLDPRQARIVELRFFGGLTGEEIAEAVGVSTATVTRELRVAQAWLYRAMCGKAAQSTASQERR